jgi:hypothetical protein
LPRSHGALIAVRFDCVERLKLLHNVSVVLGRCTWSNHIPCMCKGAALSPTPCQGLYRPRQAVLHRALDAPLARPEHSTSSGNVPTWCQSPRAVTGLTAMRLHAGEASCKLTSSSHAQGGEVKSSPSCTPIHKKRCISAETSIQDVIRGSLESSRRALRRCGFENGLLPCTEFDKLQTTERRAPGIACIPAH